MSDSICQSILMSSTIGYSCVEVIFGTNGLGVDFRWREINRALPTIVWETTKIC